MIEGLKGQRVLVTGATGFIGGYLARRLHAGGAHVLALERSPGKGRDLAALGIEIVAGDITNTPRLAELIKPGVRVVMHLAAWLGYPSDLELAQTVNVDATRRLAEASAAAGVERFVFTSSIAVYGGMGDADVDERTPLKLFGDPYGDSKIRAEQALQQAAQTAGLPFVIIRPGMVYGPGSPGWTVRMAQWAKRGNLPFIGGGQGTVYPIYIDNLIDLLVLCATHPDAAGEVFNGVDDGPVTLDGFFGGYMRMVPTKRALRLPCWLVKVAALGADPFVQRWKLAYVVNQLCGKGQISNQKAKDLLGWQPRVTLDEGLWRSEVWLREQGIL